MEQVIGARLAFQAESLVAAKPLDRRTFLEIYCPGCREYAACSDYCMNAQVTSAKMTKRKEQTT